MLCYYFSMIFYFSSMLIVITVYAFLYGRLYLSLSGMEKTITNSALTSENKGLQTILGSQFIVQLGLLTSLPMFMEIGLERRFRTVFGDTIIMQLQLAASSCFLYLFFRYRGSLLWANNPAWWGQIQGNWSWFCYPT